MFIFTDNWIPKSDQRGFSVFPLNFVFDHLTKHTQRRSIGQGIIFDHVMIAPRHERLEWKIPEEAVRDNTDSAHAPKLLADRFNERCVEFTCDTCKVWMSISQPLMKLIDLLGQIVRLDCERIC